MPDSREITKNTIKALFARSGNQCAFPKCKALLIERDDLVIGEVCHIHSPSENGPRYDELKCDDYLRSRENLIVLCPRHHKRIDAFPDDFTAEQLRQMREGHEEHVTERFSMGDTAIERVYHALEVEHLSGMFHTYPELQTLAKVLRSWHWDDKEVPQENVLDTAAWICYETVDGSPTIFNADLGIDPPLSEPAHIRFQKWAFAVKRKCGRGGYAEPGDGNHWLTKYRKLIEKILDRIRFGSGK